MFNLIDGIYLEDAGVLLRWGCSRKDALSIGHPSKIDNPHITWHDKILDGQPCDLFVDLADGAVLDEARAVCNMSHITVHDPHELFLYHALSNHLTEKIGKRPFAGYTPRLGVAPTLVWEHDGCTLKLSAIDNPWGRVGLTDILMSKM
jgi:hypothetical protein